MRRVAACLVLLLAPLGLSALALGACGATPLAPTGNRECRTNADCLGGDVCLYSAYLSCQTLGSCIANQDAEACDLQTACGCNGGTEMVCLVGGNSPSPVASLGSCDGATQQGYDANVPPVTDSSTTTSTEDAADTSVPVPPDDAAAPPPDATPEVDAADSAPPASTLGTTCFSDSQCTDPAYTLCERVSGNTKICTTECFTDSNCQPPSNGVCNLNVEYCELQ